MKRNLLIPASNEPSAVCRHLVTCMVICLMGMLFLTGCEKKPEKAADGRKKITLGAIYVSDSLKKEVAAFNKEDKEYQIEIKDYSENANVDPVTMLNTDILSGNTPDLIGLMQLPLEQYAGKGILEDLTPYFEQDKDISEDDLLDSLVNAMKIDGKLYYLVSSFEVKTLVAGKKTVDSDKGWNYQKMKQLLDTMEDDMRALPYDSKNDRFINLMHFGGGYNEFVDWKEGSCNFDCQEFKDMLAICNDGNDDTAAEEIASADEVNMLTSMLKNGKILFVPGRITPDQILANRKMLGQDITCLGSYFSFSDTSDEVGIYAKSAVKEGAWRFLKRLVSREYQGENLLHFWDMPSRKDCIEDYIKTMTATEGYTDEFGNVITPLSSVECADGNVVKTSPLGEADVELFRNFLNDTFQITGYEQQIFTILSEEVSDYFSGDKDLDETVSVIQNRVANYMNERK
ncbi:MAG: extracellular solute-binding protein [Lachnospiraceae bacterium]|nr:extracellular solute-binding protein [Lachnospiraceae bacterium]